MADDSLAISVHWGNRDGEEDNNEAPAVDERRRANAKDARARKDKDHGDRAETQADRGSDISEGKGARCDAE
jgi:hypothetical protein